MTLTLALGMRSVSTMTDEAAPEIAMRDARHVVERLAAASV